MHNILAIIPARGGSVGIPRKNLRPLNGRPLISYTIRTALKSRYGLDVYVSSDDDEILFIAKKYGAQTYKRPPALADSATTLDPVVYDAYINISRELNKQYDLIITLQPTSPLLRVDSLDTAISSILNDENIDTVLSAKDTTHLTWSKKDNDFVPNYEKRVNRQFLPPVYTETGGFLITRSSVITESSRIGKNVSLQILDRPEESIDIDSLGDFNLAEYYIRAKEILFIVSGFQDIGYGHIYRALLLANHITNHNLAFLVTSDSKEGYDKIKDSKYNVFMQQNNLLDDIKSLQPDVVINDILDTDEDYVKALKQMGIMVVNFEDLGSGAAFADLTINALYGQVAKHPNVLSGPDYFCAREEFRLTKDKKIENQVRKIVISYGGTDAINLTEKTLGAVYGYCVANNIDITVILGLGYRHDDTLRKYKKIKIFRDVKAISEFFEEADLIFTSYGRTVYEIACIGTPAILLAQNKRELAHTFASPENGFMALGLGQGVAPTEILDTMINLINDFDKRKEMGRLMLSHDLKSGTQRVIDIIQRRIAELNDYK